MRRRGAIALLVVCAGCGFKNPGYHYDAGDDALGDGGGGDDDGGSGSDGPAGPCQMPAIDLHVATLSGCADAGTADGPRGTARFSDPVNVALAHSGLAYIADFDSNLIRRIDTDGTTTTLISRPDFSRPFGLTLSVDGYLYVETDDDDMHMHSSETGTIWKVDPAGGSATVIVRDIGRPRGLAFIPDGRLAIADHMHDVVELLDVTTGTLTVLAGMRDVAGHVNATGTAAEFAEPYDVVPYNGDLVVTDLDNNVLRRVTLTGVVTDFAGTGASGHDDEVYASATFAQPKGAAVDATGAIYVTEALNHDVRKLTGGSVTTLAGSTLPGWLDTDTPAQAMFYGVEGLDVSSDGARVVIADGDVGDGMPYNRVREVH
ncbi:MAG TPA: hypothetical protein VLX92_28735 [Kofleriaceae bacterium]|nr:hypothetical protein [Kofleriaceae bacterium]